MYSIALSKGNGVFEVLALAEDTEEDNNSLSEIGSDYPIMEVAQLSYVKPLMEAW